jgi:Omp85 superfamily domain
MTAPRSLVLLILASAPRIAAAQPAEPTAAEVANAPVPGQESGRVDDDEQHDSALREIGRGLLVPPKLLLEVVIAPVRGLTWADDRYDLQGMYDRTFFNADHTIGLFPTATYVGGIGAEAGARFQATDLAGEHEAVALQAMTGAITGDTYRAAVLASANTGDRLSHWLRLGIEGSFDRRPADPFYGIGNGNQVMSTGTPIDPQTDATAVETFNRFEQARAGITADAHVGSLHLEATGAVYDISYAPSTSGTPIEDVYLASDLVGFEHGVHQDYGELALRWDTRRRGSVWEPVDVHSAGSLAAGFLGRIDGLDGASSFWRYGVELQHFWQLADGPDTLMVAFHGEGVTGAVDQVPFSELPMLGGGTYLRGYTYERFRDRVAAFGTLQYEWTVSHYADAYLFSDVGRVYDSLDAIDARDLRVGYGIGLRLRGQTGFLLEGNVASSIDGGVLVNVSLDPIVDTATRWR